MFFGWIFTLPANPVVTKDEDWNGKWNLVGEQYGFGNIWGLGGSAPPNIGIFKGLESELPLFGIGLFMRSLKEIGLMPKPEL
jgi:hypothetical protein